MILTALRSDRDRSPDVSGERASQSLYYICSIKDTSFYANLPAVDWEDDSWKFFQSIALRMLSTITFRLIVSIRPLWS